MVELVDSEAELGLRPGIDRLKGLSRSPCHTLRVVIHYRTRGVITGLTAPSSLVQRDILAWLVS